MKKFLPVLVLAFSSAAWAQTGELWFNFGESLLENNGIGTEEISPFGTPLQGASGNNITLANDWRFSFRFGFNQGEHFGHEVEYAYNRTQLQFAAVPASFGQAGQPSYSAGMAFHQGGYNFLYYIGTGSDRKFRPFVTAGVMFDDFVPPGSSGAYGGGSNKFGANFGAGVKIHIKGIWAARVDAREYVSGKPSFGFALNSGDLWQTEISAGVGIGF